MTGMVPSPSGPHFVWKIHELYPDKEDLGRQIDPTGCLP